MSWPKAEEEEDERAKSEAALILLIPADGRREIKQPTNVMCCIGHWVHGPIAVPPRLEIEITAAVPSDGGHYVMHVINLIIISAIQ